MRETDEFDETKFGKNERKMKKKRTCFGFQASPSKTIGYTSS
jgi:hypothetical protein